MIRVGILGATGYTGRELIRILLKHPQVRLTYLSAKINKPQPIYEIFPEFRAKLDLICNNEFKLEQIRNST
ncbi:MAG: N-acetyl-gamma-glutamyl-phosphate reductase, partial [Candidatus Omnitrophica bacterium]|nr:N-acetyl-gamma-glutamyl-phosphate reductase [Candidatus Omnitrophota bacterium]